MLLLQTFCLQDLLNNMQQRAFNLSNLGWLMFKGNDTLEISGDLEQYKGHSINYTLIVVVYTASPAV